MAEHQKSRNRKIRAKVTFRDIKKKKEQKPQRKTCNTVFVQERSETKQTKRTIVKPFA